MAAMCNPKDEKTIDFSRFCTISSRGLSLGLLFMKPEVHEFIDQAPLSRASVEGLAGMLPEDDAELDNWISEIVRESDQKAFMLFVIAALSRERPVHARHLVSGAKLIGVQLYLPAIAFRMQGDVPEYLMEGIRNTAIYNRIQATALVTIAIWCDENRGGVYPDQLIPEARALARRVNQDNEVTAYLLDLAVRANDPALHGLVRSQYPKATDENWKKVIEEGRRVVQITIEASRGPILGLVPETPLEPLNRIATVRRAVPRIGRNDPCHCGSGKKYKNCCYSKDQERLQHSSDVAGLTHNELSASLERHLTMERLEKMTGPQLAHMDPFEIPGSLLTEYFVRLSLFDLDRAAEYSEKFGYTDDLEDAWFFVMWAAVRAGRKDIGDRMMKLREPAGFTEDQLRLSQRLLLAQDDPAKCVLLIEEAALNALKTEKSEDLIDVAYSVAFSKFSALGILLYRGVLPLASPQQVENNYSQLLLIRDRLNLPPDDPVHELLEARKANDGEDAAAALREAEEKFEAKRREVRALKESLDQIQKELARRERSSALDSPASVPGAPESEERLRELRQKVKYLEADLNEKHDERNALERRLEEMQAKVDAHERARLATPVNGGDPDHEEDLLLPQDAEGNHPLRLIEFPRNFHERLSEFPHHVARGAMVMLGRLAGGDSAAFSGAKRLKSRPNVVRQRIGIDFRLLFRLLPDRIQVIDLIPRQDFERRIKTLG